MNIKILFQSVLLFGYFISFGQTHIKKSMISASGGSYNNGSINIVYTSGEIAVQEISQTNIHLSEGFIGPDIMNLLGITNYSELKNIEVFPNPVKDDLFIQLPEKKDFNIYLFDLSGKKIFETATRHKRYRIKMNLFPASVYMLIVVDTDNKQSKIIKIQKK